MKFKMRNRSTLIALIFIQIVPITLSDIVWPPLNAQATTENILSLKNQDGRRLSPELGNFTRISGISEAARSSSSCKCGLSPTLGQANRIVGGSAAQIHSIPWRCALFYEDQKKVKRFYCGCSIIDRSWAITAAHCTNAFNIKRTKFFVDVGDHDLSTTSETNNRFIPVTAVKQHEKYNRITLNNDISLLQLGSPVTDEDTASPACLPFKFQNKSFDRAVVTVSGWGVTKEGNRVRPAVLQKVDLKVISPQQCRRYNYGKSKITDQMICTYLKGADACQGDSGSSIDYYDAETRRFYALGVVSFGRGCGRTSPGVFARLTAFLPWIKTNSVGATFCED